MIVLEQIQGRCACGAVRFSGPTRPLAVYNCHCQACQAAQGRAYSPIMLWSSEAISVQGRLQATIMPSADGSDHAHCHGCAACSSPLFASNPKRPDIIVVRASALVGAPPLDVIADIWAVSALATTPLDPHLPKVYKSPPLLRAEESVEL